MFDGLMYFIKQQGLSDEKMIETLNTLTTSYNIKWSFKPHNTEIKNILDDLEVNDNVNFFIGDTEYDVAIYCIENIFKNKLIKCQGELYAYDNKIWTKIDSISVITRELGRHDLYISHAKGDILISKNTSAQDSLSKMIIRNVNIDNDFSESMYKSTLFKICFQNGFWDFKSGMFHEYTDNNIPLTPFIINRNYTPNKSKYDELYEKVLYPTFNIKFDNNGVIQEHDNLQRLQHLKYILHAFSVKISGDTSSKEWMMFLGDRNSGKGIFNKLFETAFTSYITSTNSSNFICKKFNSGDAAKSYSWMMPFEFTRLIFTNEIKTTLDAKGKPDTYFDSEILKKISSGGDYIECRTNHKDERKFHIQSSLIMCCNDEPYYTCNDATDYLNKFNMPCRFLTNEEYEKVNDTVKKQFIRQVADPCIKNEFCNNIDVIESFVNLIFEAYKWNVKCPEYVKDEIKEENNDTNDYVNILVNLFEFEEGSFLSNDDIIETIRHHNIVFSLIKITKILTKAGYIKHHNGKHRGLLNIKHI